eukprot:3311741-Rhodomonas_salina.1
MAAVCAVFYGAAGGVEERDRADGADAGGRRVVRWAKREQQGPRRDARPLRHGMLHCFANIIEHADAFVFDIMGLAQP